MPSKHEERDLRLSFLPWRPGLVTAGQKSSIPEDAIWKCTNGGPALDGLLSKRPALTQWGQTIMSPNEAAAGSTLRSFVSFLSGLSGFLVTDSSSGKIVASATKGSLQTTVDLSAGSETYFLSNTVSALSASSKWSLRFLFRGTALSAYTPSGTTANTFAVRAQGAAGSGKEFAIWSGGLYWKRASDSQYVLVAGSQNVGVGSWNSIEIRCDDAAGSTLVYLNDVLLETLVSADLADVTLTGTSSFEFRWRVMGSGAANTQYSTHVTTVMYNDSVTNPFIVDKIVALTDYQFVTEAGSTIRSLLIGAGAYIYHDQNLEGGWRPLHPKTNSHVYFAPYRTTIVWTDHNNASTSDLWQWDGQADPVLLDDAPNVRFVVEHQNRLLGWGDLLNPRRLYYSGTSQPNVWFSPAPDNTEDSFDELLDAGYVEIPSKGVEIRAVLGDFYGLAVLAAKNGFWKLGGYGTFSFRMDGIKLGIGAANARCLAQVGNDAWALGPQGIVSLATTDQYGDLQAAFPSVPIQNLWNPDVSSGDSINKSFMDTATMAYNTNYAQVVIGVPLIGDQGPANLFVFNTNTRKFYGPWEVEGDALASVEIASPVTEVVMTGGASGKVGYFNPFSRLDYSTTGYSLRIESPSYNGRSQNPGYTSLVKSWRTLRLLVNPRGDWDYTVTYWTDTNTKDYSVTRKQLENSKIKHYVLDEDFRLDLTPDALLVSGNEIIVHEIALDIEEHDLELVIEQTGSGEDLAIQGLEIDAVVLGYQGD